MCFLKYTWLDKQEFGVIFIKSFIKMAKFQGLTNNKNTPSSTVYLWMFMAVQSSLHKIKAPPQIKAVACAASWPRSLQAPEPCPGRGSRGSGGPGDGPGSPRDGVAPRLGNGVERGNCRS